jgi:hypothetical protein
VIDAPNTKGVLLVECVIYRIIDYTASALLLLPLYAAYRDALQVCKASLNERLDINNVYSTLR